MKNSRIAGACLLAAMFAGGVARADDDEEGFYFGGGVGRAREESGDFDSDDTSFRVFGGYSFNRYFSAEAGYIDAGNITDELGPYRISFASDGFFATGIAKLPIGPYFAPFAKIGYTYYDTTATVSSGGLSESTSDSESDFIYGGGFEFKLGENFRLRAEYDEINVSDAAFDIISLNAAWKF